MNKQKKIYSFNSELYKVTGVQKVLMDVHNAVREEYDAKIVGTIAFKKVHKDIPIKKEEYVRIVNPFMFRNSIVIIHERKFLLFFWLLNYIFCQNIKLIYVHHNVFYNHKKLSIMPKIVVAISDEGVKNLHNYFKVPKENIHKIHNCVCDIHPEPHKINNEEVIRILYPARINAVKRQTEIVKHLKGKLLPNIKIIFVGTGPEQESLERIIQNDPNFEYLGYRTDIYNLLQKVDYMMLFSQQEGLPISLIESMMMGVPAICNNVGGNSEIIKNEDNGFIVGENDWEGLIKIINDLKNINNKKYKEMSEYSRRVYLNSFSFDMFRNNYLAILKKS